MARPASLRSSSKLRALLFRAAALMIGLLPFFVAEVALRISGWQPPTEREDPFIGFDEIRPLFELREQEDRYVIGESRLEYFRPESFAAHKSLNEVRIFVLGGSTVQGRPYSTETSFTTWLELTLQAADPSRKWEVVNCGGVSYASYRLAPIMNEVLRYSPDLVILYTGHNEFLEDRTYQDIKQVPTIVSRAHAVMSNSRTYVLCRSAWLNATGKIDDGKGKSVLPREVDAQLDYEDGLKDYHRDESWRSSVVQHFRFNLRRMVAAAQQSSVPVLLVDPVCNLQDCPPFKTEPRDALTDEENRRVESLWQQAGELIDSQPERALQLLLQAVEIDDSHAGLQFDLARCYVQTKDFDKAKFAFVRGKDEDVCPLRILESMRQSIRNVARETHVPLVDIQRRFEKVSPNGIVGNQWMLDHVHPTINGHKLIADMLFENLVNQRLVTPTDGWKSRQESMYAEHLKSLNFAYFARGRQRLKGLQLWTQGRANVRMHD